MRGRLNFELTHWRQCLLDPPRGTAPLIFLPALAPTDGRVITTSVAIVRVHGAPGARLEGQRICGLFSCASLGKQPLLRVETDCLLLHLVFQEANPLRQRGGLDLGMNQEPNAIRDLFFSHVCVLRALRSLC